MRLATIPIFQISHILVFSLVYFIFLLLLSLQNVAPYSYCHNTVKDNQSTSFIQVQIMHPTLPMSWPKALIRSPDFRATVEKEVLDLERQELGPVQQNLERDLLTVTTEWNVTRGPVNSNNQAYVECVAQIEQYSALCTSPPVKIAA